MVKKNFKGRDELDFIGGKNLPTDFVKLLATGFNLDEVIAWLNFKADEDRRLYGGNTNLNVYAEKLRDLKNTSLKIFRIIFNLYSEGMQDVVVGFAEKNIFPEKHQDGSGTAIQRTIMEANAEFNKSVIAEIDKFEKEYYFLLPDLIDLVDIQDDTKTRDYDFAGFLYNTYSSGAKEYFSNIIALLKDIRTFEGKTINSQLKGKVLSLFEYFSIESISSIVQEHKRGINMKNYKRPENGVEVTRTVDSTTGIRTVQQPMAGQFADMDNNGGIKLTFGTAVNTPRRR